MKTVLQIGTDMLLIITSTVVTSFLGVSTSMTINDLESHNKVFIKFFAILGCDAQMAGDGPRQPAYEIFSIKVHFCQSKF